MKKYFCILFSFCFFLTLDAQDSTLIVVQKKGIDYLFFKQGKKLNSKQLLIITKPISSANDEMTYARNYQLFAKFFSYSGGFMIGYPLGVAITGGEANWKVAGLGLGLVAVSIPFQLKFNKHAKKAVELYNLNQNKSLNMTIAPNNITFSLSF